MRDRQTDIPEDRKRYTMIDREEIKLHVRTRGRHQGKRKFVAYSNYCHCFTVAYTRLYINLSVCLSVQPYICLSVHPSVRLSVHLSVLSSVHSFICPFIRLFIYFCQKAPTHPYATDAVVNMSLFLP